MYLDPGSTSLFVQALFAVFATALATFSKSRAWFTGMWMRLTHAMIRRRHRPEV
jgi:hypothetical protein